MFLCQPVESSDGWTGLSRALAHAELTVPLLVEASVEATLLPEPCVEKEPHDPPPLTSDITE